MLVMGNYLSVRLDQRRIFYMRGEETIKVYPIAIGKPSTPTPQGNYMVINKVLNPGGVFGTRWMGISAEGVGIHGTNAPQYIGQAVSHGCIRMYNQDVEELYEFITIGTKVIIAP